MPTNGSPGFTTTNMFDTIASNRKQPKSVSFPKGWLEFNVPFQHKYGYIRDEGFRENMDKL